MGVNVKAEYFNALNYSLANEDTRFELAICQALRPAHILAICGSGGRFLPLLTAGPKSITALDLAPQQLHLATLRQQTIRACDFQTFCLFWGFPPYRVGENCHRRREIFESLDIKADCRDYFQKLFESLAFKGLLYEGKWEKTIAVIPKLLRRLVGRSYDQLFSYTNEEEQDRYLDKKLDSIVWKLIPRLAVLVFGNAAFFNALLYRGQFVKKNIPSSYYDFYRLAFRRIFRNGLARENFFLQLFFFGEIRYPEGNTIEAIEDVYIEMKDQLSRNPEINLVQSDVLSYAKICEKTFDFVSLSDVPSYFQGDAESRYLQDLRRCLSPGATVVVRCYLRVPEGTDTRGFTDVTADYQALIAREKVQMYTIQVFRFGGLA